MASSQDGTDVVLAVQVPQPVEGLYETDGCQCAPLGFKLRQMILPANSPAPATREAAMWDEPARADGSPQPANGTAFGNGLGDGLQVRSECGATDTDVYLATQLVFPDGFVAPTVSKDSTRVECGPNIVIDPAPRPGRRPVDADWRPGDRPVTIERR